MFNFEIVYDELDFVMFYKISLRRSFGILYYLSKVLMCVLAVLIIYITSFAISNGKNAIAYLLGCIIVVLGSVFVIFSAEISGIIGYKSHQKNYGRTKLYFEDDCLIEGARYSEEKYDYRIIKDIISDKRSVYLFLNNTQAIIVPKRYLEESNRFLFPFLEEKTGLKVRENK